MTKTTMAVLNPDLAFTRMRDGLARAGWRDVSSAQEPLVPGEPEFAVFERGADERAFYSFNPVCRLRVLDIQGGADQATLNAVHPVSIEQIESWLGSDDERTLLRGVLAARQRPDRGLLKRVYALRQHQRQPVADAAVRVSDELKTVLQHRAPEDDARWQSLAIIEVLKAQVAPLLQAVSQDRTGEALLMVKPRDDDYAKAFVASAVDPARQTYARIWDADFDMRYPDADQTIIKCELAPAGMLADDNELSRRFPGGYRSIAHLLNPHRVWACWKCLRPGATAGLAYDGLAWVEDHWAWFPKPYRVLPSK